MSDMGACPDTCFNPERQPHLEPEVDWIGDAPIIHGERDVPYGDPQQEYCLCGHPGYMMCPEADSGGVMGFVVGDPYGGKLS